MNTYLSKYYIFFFIINFSFSQKIDTPLELDSLKINADFYFGKDNLGFNYSSKNNTIFKSNSHVANQYTNIILGNIANVCITNPLQIIVLYENFNTFIVLDNQLNEIQKIDCFQLNSPIKIEAIGLASKNKIWFFDSLSQQIGLFDLKSNTFQFISTPLQNKIKIYQSDYNHFYWLDSQNNFYKINIYGKIEKLSNDVNLNVFQIIDNNSMIYNINSDIFLFDFSKNESKKIISLEKSFENFFYSKNILTIFTRNQIINYKLEF